MTELSQKCEAARIEMRKYRYETEVLEILSRAIDWWKGMDCSDSKQFSCEELITQYVIENTLKNVVKESDIRQVLRLLRLPEEKVVTIHLRGGTNYELAENEEAKLRSVEEAQIEDLRKKYLRGITKIIRGRQKRICRFEL